MALHLAMAAFVIAFAASRRVRDYLGWESARPADGSTVTNDAITT